MSLPDDRKLRAFITKYGTEGWFLLADRALSAMIHQEEKQSLCDKTQEMFEELQAALADYSMVMGRNDK